MADCSCVAHPIPSHSEPEQFIDLLNELRYGASSHPHAQSSTVLSSPPPYGSLDGIRVFVALSSNRSHFEIIAAFQPHQGLEGLTKLVNDKFHRNSSSYTYTLADVGAVVTDVQSIQPNDKLIAQPIVL